MKVNEIKIKKGVDLAQHLVDFYDAQVTWVLSIIVFPLSKKTQTLRKLELHTTAVNDLSYIGYYRRGGFIWMKQTQKLEPHSKWIVPCESTVGEEVLFWMVLRHHHCHHHHHHRCVIVMPKLIFNRFYSSLSRPDLLWKNWSNFLKLLSTAYTASTCTLLFAIAGIFSEVLKCWKTCEAI